MRRPLACLGLAAALLAAADVSAQMRVTEYMYDGTDGEFIEFTNVGSTPVSMDGWSFDDDSGISGSFSLSAFGTVAAGESVILAELSADTFRSHWGLCAGVKVIGGNSQNLGRNDTIHLYDGAGQPVDTLRYGDQTFAGTIRTSGKSGVPASATALGADTIDLSGYKGVNSFGDLDGRIDQDGNDTVITLLKGDRLRLEDFDSTTLDGTEFGF